MATVAGYSVQGERIICINAQSREIETMKPNPLKDGKTRVYYHENTFQNDEDKSKRHNSSGLLFERGLYGYDL